MKYNEIYHIMKVYADFPRLDRAIIDTLFFKSSEICTYTELGKMLDTSISNVRKSVLRLEKLGAIRTEKEEKPNSAPLKKLYLVESWQENLLRISAGKIEVRKRGTKEA